MEDKEFKAQYKKEFDNIHASDELRNAVINLKPQKPRRVVTPFKATIGTVAAAVMIFAAVHDYNFEPDTSGVISETVVSTQLPEAQFEIVEKKKPVPATTTPPANGSDVATPTQKPKSVNTVTATATPTKAPTVTVKPAEEPKAEPASEGMSDDGVAPANEVSGIVPFSDDQPTPRSGGANTPISTIEMWTVEKYYEYLGTNVSQKIMGRYTGAQMLEIEVDADGVPIKDIAVLDFATNSGAGVHITVSKNTWQFDASMSGTISEIGNGYSAYKLSNGVYYNIYVTNTTQDEVVAIVNSL